MNNQKRFGVWMDSSQAIVVGTQSAESETFAVTARIDSEGSAANSSEKTANNHEKTIQGKFFKEIASHLVNATHVHVTGTGQAQEQFIRFLAETPQFKTSQTAASTSNKMSEEKLAEFIASKF